jgi:hypothetical protein
MKWAEQLTNMGNMRKAHKILSDNLRGGDYLLKDPDACERIT